MFRFFEIQHCVTCNDTRGVTQVLTCRGISKRRLQLSSNTASYIDGEKLVFKVIEKKSLLD